MNPVEVFKAISEYKGVAQSTICMIKSHCIQFIDCPNQSKSQIIDFDGAAHTYQIETTGAKTLPSVDAIAITKAGDLLLLIEKKTWGEFFNHLPTFDKTNPTSAALHKISSYKLNDKYTGTKTICEHITKVSNLFHTMPHVFVFLSELSDIDPMGGFASDIIQLAHSSSTIDYTIQSSVVNGMKNHLSTVPCSRTRYLSCMEFDTYINNPSSFG